jgi:hypothetical protein
LNFIVIFSDKKHYFGVILHLAAGWWRSVPFGTGATNRSQETLYHLNCCLYLIFFKGEECCSQTAIGFHNVKNELFYFMDYLLYSVVRRKSYKFVKGKYTFEWKFSSKNLV